MLAAVLDGLCRLLHPIMPFVTEQVWQGLAAWSPVARACPNPRRPRRASASPPGRPTLRPGPIATAGQVVGQWCEAIKAIRNLRAERNVPKDAKIAPIIVAAGPVGATAPPGRAVHPEPVAGRVRDDRRPAADRPAECAVAVLPEVEIILPLAGLIDKEAELAKHRKALADLERQIGGHQAKLAQRVVRRAVPRPRSCEQARPS